MNRSNDREWHGDGSTFQPTVPAENALVDGKKETSPFWLLACVVLLKTARTDLYIV